MCIGVTSPVRNEAVLLKPDAGFLLVAFAAALTVQTMENNDALWQQVIQEVHGLDVKVYAKLASLPIDR